MTELQVRSVVDALHEDLRHRILVGEEEPGAVLTEVSVSVRYRVARPSAKAAIERLVADGLVVRNRRGSGASVRTFTHDDITDLYETRILVEAGVHSRLARTGSDVDSARRINARLREAADSHAAADVVALDLAFHGALVAVLGRARLIRLHQQLMSEANFCMAQVQEFQLLDGRVIAGEHEGILDAIATADPALAEARTISHLDGAKRRLLSYLSSPTAGASAEH